MSKNKTIEVINCISNYLVNTIYEEISLTSMLKIDKFLLDLKEKIRLEETNDRITKTNRG